MDKFIVSLFLIVFCGSINCDDLSVQPLRTFAMPESCKTQGWEYCFDNADYPTDIVEDLLKDMPHLEVADEGDVGKIEYSNREGDSPEDADCLSQSTNKPIYYITDDSGRTRVVVQLEGKFQQRYSINRCENEGQTKKTKHFVEATLENYKMYCQNQYMNYDFLVLSNKPGENGKYQMERAHTKTGIPVCCQCKYDKDN